MSIDWLIASGALFIGLPLIALALKYGNWRLEERRRRKHRERRGGYVTEDLIREIKFFDDGWEPRG